MNARGCYGSQDPSERGACTAGHGRTYVGASLVHVLELKQRYDKINTAAVSKLLEELAKGGTSLSTGTNRWEIALKDAAWIRLAWYPEFNGLEVTITDRELHRSDEVASVQREYEAILRRITPLLQTYGATTVGRMISGPISAPPGTNNRSDVRDLFKYGVWGALGIGAVIFLSRAISKQRTGNGVRQKSVPLLSRGRSGQAGSQR